MACKSLKYDVEVKEPHLYFPITCLELGIRQLFYYSIRACLKVNVAYLHLTGNESECSLSEWMGFKKT